MTSCNYYDKVLVNRKMFVRKLISEFTSLCTWSFAQLQIGLLALVCVISATIFSGPARSQPVCTQLEPGDSDRFGYSMEMRDDVLAVGDPSGNRVALYRRSSEQNWTRAATIGPPKDSVFGKIGLGFGYDVSLNDTDVIIGAYVLRLKDLAAAETEEIKSINAGGVYTYSLVDSGPELTTVAEERLPVYLPSMQLGSSVAGLPGSRFAYSSNEGIADGEKRNLSVEIRSSEKQDQPFETISILPGSLKDQVLRLDAYQHELAVVLSENHRRSIGYPLGLSLYGSFDEPKETIFQVFDSTTGKITQEGEYFGRLSPLDVERGLGWTAVSFSTGPKGKNVYIKYDDSNEFQAIGRGNHLNSSGQYLLQQTLYAPVISELPTARLSSVFDNTKVQPLLYRRLITGAALGVDEIVYVRASGKVSYWDNVRYRPAHPEDRLCFSTIKTFLKN